MSSRKIYKKISDKFERFNVKRINALVGKNKYFVFMEICVAFLTAVSILWAASYGIYSLIFSTPAVSIDFKESQIKILDGQEYSIIEIVNNRDSALTYVNGTADVQCDGFNFSYQSPEYKLEGGDVFLPAKQDANLYLSDKIITNMTHYSEDANCSDAIVIYPDYFRTWGDRTQFDSFNRFDFSLDTNGKISNTSHQVSIDRNVNINLCTFCTIHISIAASNLNKPVKYSESHRFTRYRFNYTFPEEMNFNVSENIQFVLLSYVFYPVKFKPCDGYEIFSCLCNQINTRYGFHENCNGGFYAKYAFS